MLQRAEAVNASHLKIFPQGFALDSIGRTSTMLQRFVRTSDLDQLYAAASKVLASSNVAGMKLEAFKILLHSEQGLGSLGHCKPSQRLSC